jgi:hypothetical protein
MDFPVLEGAITSIFQAGKLYYMQQRITRWRGLEIKDPQGSGNLGNPGERGEKMEGLKKTALKK